MKHKCRMFIDGQEISITDFNANIDICPDIEAIECPVAPLRASFEATFQLDIDPLFEDDLRRSHKAPLN